MKGKALAKSIDHEDNTDNLENEKASLGRKKNKKSQGPARTQKQAKIMKAKKKGLLVHDDRIATRLLSL